MNVGKTTIAYKKDDVWLCRYGNKTRPLTIKDIAGRCVKYHDQWETIEDFHTRAIVKLGKVRRVFGIAFGWERDA